MTPQTSLDHFQVPGIDAFHTEKYCIYELEIENLPQTVGKTRGDIHTVWLRSLRIAQHVVLRFCLYRVSVAGVAA